MSTSPQNLASDPPVTAPAAINPALAPLETAGWKQEVNARIAAHRARRDKVTAQATLPLEVDEPTVRSRARVAARVAQRYAKAPTYSAVLGQQASEVLAQQAKAGDGDEVAEERSNEAQSLGFLADLEAAEQPTSVEKSKELAGHKKAAANVESGSVESGNIQSGGFAEGTAADLQPDSEQMTDVKESIESNIVSPREWIPGNLIEFPRVLVATRKARPRLAEGPLREDATVDTDPEHSQLRIFEVEQRAISTSAEAEPVATEWSSIRLNARPEESIKTDADPNLMDKPLQSAPLSARLMAGMVDGALVALAFLAFVAVFVACTTHPPGGRPALIAAACTLVAIFMLYQCLFFTYAEATPGMRYARIALCTFGDENPTRRQMRARIGALLLSAIPLALGFVWAWFDEDRLGWHDRISKTYQRSYR